MIIPVKPCFEWFHKRNVSNLDRLCCFTLPWMSSELMFWRDLIHVFFLTNLWKLLFVYFTLLLPSWLLFDVVRTRTSQEFVDRNTPNVPYRRSFDLFDSSSDIADVYVLLCPGLKKIPVTTDMNSVNDFLWYSDKCFCMKPYGFIIF